MTHTKCPNSKISQCLFFPKNIKIPLKKKQKWPLKKWQKSPLKNEKYKNIPMGCPPKNTKMTPKKYIWWFLYFLGAIFIYYSISNEI